MRKGQGAFVNVPREWSTYLVAAAFAMAIAAAGCVTNPATGRTVPVAGLSNAGEADTGRQQNPAVLDAFGGAFDDATLQSYVNDVGQKVAAQSERRGIRYTFTILDTPVVNALAIPGGYIYITRGLLAIVNDESELAGVLGHEVGHVAAMHHAQAQARQTMSQIGRTAGSMVFGRSPLSRVTQVAALNYAQSYSRDDEYEADMLGIRYAAKAGYDPRSMATFLATMREYARLEAIMAGRPPDSVDQLDYMSTHPTAADRFTRALAEASGQVPAKPIVGRKIYLGKIDGLLYGESPAQGFIRGRVFEHPIARIRFEVPPGFQLLDTADRVFGIGPSGSVIVFDSDVDQSGLSITDYLTQVWAKGAFLQDVRRGDMNGLQGATGTIMLSTPRGPMNVRLVAFRVDATHIYRFRFESPPSMTAQLTPGFAKTTASFKILSPAEAAALKARSIKIIAVAKNDTIGGLARRIPFEDYKLERFRMLNALAPDSQITPGQQLKLIVE
ncbi:MAG: M48 family metalloprotease [Candidatus Binataceae bacterium]